MAPKVAAISVPNNENAFCMVTQLDCEVLSCKLENPGISEQRDECSCCLFVLHLWVFLWADLENRPLQGFPETTQ